MANPLTEWALATIRRSSVERRVENLRKAIVVTRPNQTANEPPTFSAPTTSIGKPIPFIIGRQLITDPNLLSLTNIQAATINGEAGFTADMQYGLCLGDNVQLVGIRENNVEQWSGLVGPEKTNITMSNLVGHLRGETYFYGGQFDQPAPTELASALSGRNPAYRGVAHMVILDAEYKSSLDKISFELARYPNPLSLSAENNIRNGDVNVVSCIAEILTNEWGGIGLSLADHIDLDAFTAAATLRAADRNYAAVSIDDGDPFEVIDQLCQQADCILYHDPAQGKMSIAPIDYPVIYTGTPAVELNTNNVKSCSNWYKTAQRDIRAIQRLIFTDRSNDYDKASITSQNQAELRKSSTSAKPVVTSFPAIFDLELAGSIVVRELRKNSVPFFSFDIEANRDAANVKPGDVVSVTWPELYLTDEPVLVRDVVEDQYDRETIILSVERYLYPDFSGLVISIIVDRFGITTDEPVNPIYARPLLVHPDIVYDMDNTVSLTDGRPNGGLGYQQYPLEDGPYNAYVAVVAEGANVFQTGFDLYTGAPITESVDLYSDKPYWPSAVLQTTIPVWSLDGTDLTIDVNATKLFSTLAATPAYRKGWFIIDDEWFLYSDLTDNMDGSYTLTGVMRAAGNSISAAHAVGTLVYFIPVDTPTDYMFTDLNPRLSEWGNMGLVGVSTEGTAPVQNAIYRSYDLPEDHESLIGGNSPIDFAVDGDRDNPTITRNAVNRLECAMSYPQGYVLNYGEKSWPNAIDFLMAGRDVLALTTIEWFIEVGGVEYSVGWIIGSTRTEDALFFSNSQYDLRCYGSDGSTLEEFFNYHAETFATLGGPIAGYTAETEGGIVKRIKRDYDGAYVYMSAYKSDDPDQTYPERQAMGIDGTSGRAWFELNVPNSIPAGAGFLYAKTSLIGYYTESGTTSKYNPTDTRASQSRISTPREKLPVTLV